MPTSIPHLIAARKYNPNASLDFYIGNIAPDVVNGEDKDTTHFRNSPDMLAAIKNFALENDPKNEYIRGIVLHLFVDYKWAEIVLADFVNREGRGVFKSGKYREEIDRLASDSFHSTDWADGLYQQMLTHDIPCFVETSLITRDGLKYTLKGQYEWATSNKLDPSTAFPMSLINEFTTNIIPEFNEWSGSFL